MKWDIFALARTGPSYVMAAVPDECSERGITASGATKEAAMLALQRRMAEQEVGA